MKKKITIDLTANGLPGVGVITDTETVETIIQTYPKSKAFARKAVTMLKKQVSLD